MGLQKNLISLTLEGLCMNQEGPSYVWAVAIVLSSNFTHNHTARITVKQIIIADSTRAEIKLPTTLKHRGTIKYSLLSIISYNI